MYLLTEFETQNVAGGTPVIVTDELRAEINYYSFLSHTIIGALGMGVVFPLCNPPVHIGVVVGIGILGAMAGAISGTKRGIQINSELENGQLYDYTYLTYIYY